MRQKYILSILFVTLLLDMVGIGMLIPILPSLFTDPLSPHFILDGYSTSSQYMIAGVLTALFGLMQFISAPILGELSDMYGRKKLLTLGVGVLALSQLIFALGISYASLPVLFVSRAIAGIAGANFSIAQATIADVSSVENRARNFGLIGGAFGLGFVIGPVLGGTIAGSTGNAAAPFIFAGILGIINVLLVTFFLRETHHTRAEKKKVTFFRALHNIQHAISDHHVRPLYSASFFVMLGFGFYTSFIAILLSSHFHFNETMTGSYFALVGMWMIFSQVVIVRILSRKYKDITRLLCALPVVCFCIALQPFMPQVTYLYILMPVLSGSFALVTTSIPALVSAGVDADKRGVALGINGSLQALSQTIAPLMAGVIAGVFGLPVAFIIGALSIFLSFIIVYRKNSHTVALP
jgi:DHA1 family tetracycline resistance protein-like MFS transporter